MFGIKFLIAPLVPQLFLYMDENECVVMILAKTVDDMLFAGSASMTQTTIDLIDKKFELQIVAHGPGLMHISGLNLEQKEDMTITIHADDKLNAMESYPPSRIGRQQVDDALASTELKSLVLLNCAVDWLGSASCMPCSESVGRMLQLSPQTKIKALLTQAAGIRQLKELGTFQTFSRPLPRSTHFLSLLVFSDAGRNCNALKSLQNSACQYERRRAALVFS